VPQAGSGTRNFWAAQSTSSDALPSCVHDTIVAPAPPCRSRAQRHRLRPGRPAIGPFSIAQFDSQSNGHNDRRHTWSCTAWPWPPPWHRGRAERGRLAEHQLPDHREVYTRARHQIVNSGTGFNPTLAALLVGPSSQLCSDELTILSFGFATLTARRWAHLWRDNE